MMKRHIPLAARIVFLLAACLPLGAAPPLWAAAADRVNVVFLLTDDQRADTIAALGNSRIDTPNLDQLAREGFVFENAYCLGSNSGAVCQPSRNTLLSGRAYFRFGRYASADDPNLPRSFREAGYFTYHHGKIGNSAREIHKVFHVSRYLDDDRVRRSGRPGEQIVDQAIDFLHHRPDERPFLLYLAFAAPHDPRVAAAGDRQRYSAEPPPLPENYLPLHPFDNGDMTIRDEQLAAWPRSEEEIQRHLTDYYAVITGLDRQIGRLVEALRETGQLDRTLIVFTSDHGLAIGSHGLMGKQNLYEHSMKVPLVFSGAGIRPGRSSALVYLMDLFPTLCELTGIEVPSGLDGTSLLPVLSGGTESVRDSLFTAYKDLQRSVRDSRFKCIRYPRIHRTQLFDLAADPHETHDLSDDPAHAERIDRMLDLMAQWQQRLADKDPLTAAEKQSDVFAAPAGDEVSGGKGAVRTSRTGQPVQNRGQDAAASPKERPNFVIFLADDLGWGDLGCYGHPIIRTPHLDQFASQGLLLTECYSACSVCSPSRSAILTGRTPYRNGVWRWIPEAHRVHLRRCEVTIASLLRERGYATCHAGKWHLNGGLTDDETPQPDDHGYDHWFATQNNAEPHHVDPVNFVRNGTPVGPVQGFSAGLVVDEAIGWLESRSPRDEPFFLTVWTHEPHLPIETAPEFIAPYSEIPDEGTRQHHGNVTQLDHAFGRLMEALDRLGLVDNTFVFFTSDNGPEGDGLSGRTRGSTGGLRGRKRSSYEGGIRVPGLFRWPGRAPAGSRSDQPVIGCDIFATLCDIARVGPPDKRVIDGASLLPLFSGRPVIRSEPLYWRNHLAPAESRIALREGRWKIVGSDDRARFELFDLERDPGETDDVSEEFPAQFREMRRRLTDQDLEVLAEGPSWWRDEP